MLVAIMGSQGSGKTWLLNELKQQGLHTVDRKTSRSILSDWNVSLEEVNNTPALTTKFQDEIIKRKHQDEQDALTSAGKNGLIFTERTYVDLFAYACISLGKDNRYSDWLDDYYSRCLAYQQNYDLVYYLTAGHFKVQHDGIRGSNRHYSIMVDTVMMEFATQMSLPSKLVIVKTPDLKERVNMISIQTKQLLAKGK